MVYCSFKSVKSELVAVEACDTVVLEAQVETPSAPESPLHIVAAVSFGDLEELENEKRLFLDEYTEEGDHAHTKNFLRERAIERDLQSTSVVGPEAAYFARNVRSACNASRRTRPSHSQHRRRGQDKRHPDKQMRQEQAKCCTADKRGKTVSSGA